jgi:Cdc6-like AAA superfamily ATPase
LGCPDSLEVKTRLLENKDKLLHKSFNWILRDPQYLRWQDGDDIGLLWIKGGAGKGKTMMSKGLIEKFLQQSQQFRETTAVTYFFCQNADYELNTMEAIIKGLILQLVKQQQSVATGPMGHKPTALPRRCQFVADIVEHPNRNAGALPMYTDIRGGERSGRMSRRRHGGSVKDYRSSRTGISISNKMALDEWSLKNLMNLL